MARKVLIQVRRGAESSIGTLAAGELGYCTDTSKLYIGTATGNVLLVAAQSTGDMLKGIYDTNNNGKVDAAEVADAVPWAGVTGKPGTFAPSAHTHDALSVKSDNWKQADALPSTYDRGLTVFFSNSPTNRFDGVQYCTVMTVKGYSNMAAVQYLYPYNQDSPIRYRYALFNSDVWLPWRQVADTATVMPKGPLTWAQLRGDA